MGYWFPTFEIAGGLYGGFATPSGDLSSFIDMCNVTLSNPIMSMFGTYTDRPSDPNGDKAWVGAYGSSSDKYITYARDPSHYGPGYDFPFMIFNVSVPENAEYYKQELVIEMRTATVNRSGGDSQATPPTDYMVQEYAPYYHRIYRRVYDTPYSTPYVTHEWGVNSGHLHYSLREGHPELAGWLDEKFYFPISYAEYNGEKYLCFCEYSAQYTERGEWDPDQHQWEQARRYTYPGWAI